MNNWYVVHHFRKIKLKCKYQIWYIRFLRNGYLIITQSSLYYIALFVLSYNKTTELWSWNNFLLRLLRFLRNIEWQLIFICILVVCNTVIKINNLNYKWSELYFWQYKYQQLQLFSYFCSVGPLINIDVLLSSEKYELHILLCHTIGAIKAWCIKYDILQKTHTQTFFKDFVYKPFRFYYFICQALYG